MRQTIRFLKWFVVLAILLPIAAGAALSYSKGWASSWRSANWSSSGLLPLAVQVPEARVMILAARTGRWKGIFAEHMSIVLKPAGADHWTRYDVVGWGDPVRRDNYAADAFWYGNRPRIIHEVSGAEAASLIPRIEKTIAAYPYQRRGDYVVWPGPNSNSFVAWVVRHTDGFNAELSSVAVGKDWLGPGLAIDRAPSATGWTASAAGFIGVTLAREEGFELSLLGSTIGIDFDDAAIKLPAIGKLSPLGS